MTGEMKIGLDDAYGLSTPDDSRRLYRDWAGSYDESFVKAHGYVYHQEIAALFARLGGRGPTLDVGCGTGVVGRVLTASPVDGLDISPEMLEAARAKGCYRELIEADLTATLPMPDGAYQGLISAGTFTEGHVGADALDELIRVAAPGALFVLGVNQRVYEELGFPAALARHAAAGAIEPARFETGRIYAKGAGHEHEDEHFLAAVFKRL